MYETQQKELWDIVTQLVEQDDRAGLEEFFHSLSRSDKILIFSRLDEEIHPKVIGCLSTETAADLMEDLNDDQAADLILDLPESRAAKIVDEMASDEQADVLSHLAENKAEAILQKMDPEEAEDARRLLKSPGDTAGGLMITEFMCFPESARVKDVIRNLRQRGDEYSDYDIHYLYVTSQDDKLTGVLPLWRLVRSDKNILLTKLAIPNPVHVQENATLEELKNVVDHHDFIGIPVTDFNGRLVGIVRRRAVLDVIDKLDDQTFLNFSGIVGGDELRSMPLLSRSFHRLSWLSVNILLNILAASVIMFYQDTIAAVIALAVFLPIISDMSGCSGNQAVAVSIRELSIGQIKPHELMRVLIKEAGVGVINGLVLGLLIGGVALLWKGNIYLGLVVGGALALNSLFAVCLGGVIPLVLKGLKMDPALASSPILTTITDMCGFFLVLSFASSILSKIII